MRTEFFEPALNSPVLTFSIIQTAIAPIWERGPFRLARKRVLRRPEQLPETRLTVAAVWRIHKGRRCPRCFAMGRMERAPISVIEISTPNSELELAAHPVAVKS